jgi:predicted ABC-type ATPase
MKNKNMYIIAGPNGSGKTTFAKEFLPEFVDCPNFINADLIAMGLSPFLPEQVAIKAGKLVLEQINELSNRDLDFAFETTLSEKTYLKLFKELKNRGYKLHFFFLWVPHSALSIARIKNRVSDGGHNVPDEDVIRRFSRSIVNFFEYYLNLSDSWLFFDNSGIKPELIAKSKGKSVNIINKDKLDGILKQFGVKL